MGASINAIMLQVVRSPPFRPICHPSWLQTGFEQRSPGESPMFVWTLKAAAGPKTLHGYISLLLGASAMANGAAIKDQ